MQPEAREPQEALTPPPLKTFIDSIIDYAGLFPPAGLPLEEALRNFARYRQGPEAWMLARFVIPLKRLPDLAPYASLFADTPPFRFSVLGTGGADTPTFLDAFDADLHALLYFEAQYAGQVRVDAMEVRLPSSLFTAQTIEILSFLEEVGHRMEAASLSFALFFEVPFHEALRVVLPPVLAAMATYNRRRAPQVGLKMRTGGVTPDAFPPADQVAYALLACRDAGVPFKATAGLHHPVRHYHESVQTHMYGFFNVFGAAILVAAHDLDEQTVQTILLDQEASHFRFTPEAFAWKDYAVSLDALHAARQAFATSFGSCSFDEPRDDLRTLGLL